MSEIISVDPSEGNINQSEGGMEACAYTSTVKSKSSSPIKAFHLSADDVIEMLMSDEEPPAKKLRCTIDVELVIVGLRLSDIETNLSQRLLKLQFSEINGSQ